MFRLILQSVGAVIVGLMRLTFNLVFLLSFLTLSMVAAAVVGVWDKVKEEPRLVCAVVYMAIGAWIIYTLLSGVTPGVDRLSVLEGL